MDQSRTNLFGLQIFKFKSLGLYYKDRWECLEFCDPIKRPIRLVSFQSFGGIVYKTITDFEAVVDASQDGQ